MPPEWPCALLVAIGLGILPSSDLAAQQPRRLLPDRTLLPKLLAAPQEPVTAAKFVFQIDSPTQFGEILEGEAAFGASVPLYLISGSSKEDAILVGVEGGVFARFNMETRERELITSDWYFMLPVVVRRGNDWLRLRYFHTSAHFGDEYLERFQLTRRAYARDAVEGTAYFRPLDAFGLYVAGRWAFRVDPPEHGPFVVRGGAEFELTNGRNVLPYAAADVALDQEDGWTPRLNLQAGIRLFPRERRPSVRIGLELFTGPAVQGQLHDVHTTYLTLGATLDL
jgi:hypothetical protein